MQSLGSAQKNTSSNRAFIAIGVFFYFAMTMALYAGITLLHLGSALDRLWTLNLDAHRQLLQFRDLAGIGFVMLAAVTAIAGIAWFRRRLWGWQIAVFGVAVQLLGDCQSYPR